MSPVLLDVLGGRNAAADHMVAGGVERIDVPVLPFAGRERFELVGDEANDQIVDLHCGLIVISQ